MEQFQFSLTSLLIVTSLSFLVPIIIKKIKRVYIPVVVGEIIVGMIIGKSGLDMIEMDQALHFIQFFGLSYLMFVAGLEIDFDIFTKKNNSKDNQSTYRFIKNPLVLSSLILMITLGLAYVVSYILKNYHLVNDPLLMSLVIGTTSLGIVVPILKEKKISTTPYGQYIITGAVLADFVTMLLISVAISIFKGGIKPEILLIFALLLLVFIIYQLSRWLQKNKLFSGLAHGTTQIGIRGSFAVMLLFLVLSHKIGVEMILGSFLAGTVIALVSKTQREEIYHKLDAIGFGFLIPTFFILVGVNFDASVLLSNPKGLVLVPILFFIFYLVKGIPALLLRIVFPWRKTIAAGLLLTSKLSLTIAAAAIGYEIGAISKAVSESLLLVSILTSLISPMIFGKLIPEQKEDEAKHVIIIGTTKDAILLAKRLKEFLKVHIIDSKKEKIEDLSIPGIEMIWGDALDMDILEGLSVQDAKSIIVATGSDEINYKISTTISDFYKIKVIALLNDPRYIEEVKQNSFIGVINPQLAAVHLLENMVIHPIAATLFEGNKGMHMEEVVVSNARFIGINLRFIQLPGDVLIFAIYRNGETILPHGDTTFEYGDILLVLGSDKDIEIFSKYAVGH